MNQALPLATDSADAGVFLSLCALEPIHIPGAIQPHGALLGVRSGDWRVSHASANLAAVLGRAPEDVLGAPLADAIGAAATEALRGTIGAGPSPRMPPEIRAANGAPLLLSAHPAGAYALIDIEPAPAAGSPAACLPAGGSQGRGRLAQSIVQRLNEAATREALYAAAVQGLRAVTCYDRVMVYRFADDGHGEVVAEFCEPGLEPYLGQHYPASDIPPQARRLYLRQRVGAVADSAYAPVPLLTDPNLDDARPLDLTGSALRSVSPMHREYMRNMKTAASLTVGLARGGALWGMLVCHHATPRVADPETRAAAAIIGQVVSLLLDSLGEAEIAARRRGREGTMRMLMDRMSGRQPLPNALAAAETEVLRLVDAGGAAIRLDNGLCCIGRTPPAATVARIVDYLLPAAQGDALAVDDLGLRQSDLGDCAQTASGALLLPLGGEADAMIWFRPEVSRTIVWGGSPTEHVTRNAQTGGLSPRTSFSAWRETVRGRSLAWADADLAVARLFRRALETAQARRVSDELTRVRGDLAAAERREAGERPNGERYRAVIDGIGREPLSAAPDATVLVDPAGTIVLANRPAERAFGYARGALLGARLEMLIPGGLAAPAPDDAAKDDGAPDDAAPDGSPSEQPAGSDSAARGAIERVGVREDGSAFPIEIMVGRVETAEGVMMSASIRDISRRKAQERRFAQMELQYRGLLEAAPDAMVMVNAVGEIALVNRQAERQFGYGRDELIGQDVTVIIPDGLNGRLTARLGRRGDEVAGDGETFGIELSGRRKGGGRFPIDVQLGPLHGAEGMLVAAAIRDITARKLAEEQLSQKILELNRSNAELDKFAAVASHDLQEPLRMVASYTQLLARRYKGRLDSDADEFIAFAVDGANRMQHLIQDMLAYSRIGTPGTKLRPVSAEAALAQALLSLRGAIEQSGALVTHDRLPIVLGEQAQLAQLFQNLLSNAIKYQRATEPRIQVSATRTDAGLWLFSVKDNGIGIDPRYFDRIFGIFQRLHKREEFAGTGMGLAICKKIVEGHGGRISVSSRPGEGSTFSFTLQNAGSTS